MNCKLVGRWRIVEADIWDRRYLDLCGPATILIRANGRGEISFGALQAGLDIEYSVSGAVAPPCIKLLDPEDTRRHFGNGSDIWLTI